MLRRFLDDQRMAPCAARRRASVPAGEPRGGAGFGGRGRFSCMNGRGRNGGNGTRRRSAKAPKRRSRNEATKAQVAARRKFLRENPPSPEALEAAERELRELPGE